MVLTLVVVGTGHLAVDLILLICVGIHSVQGILGHLAQAGKNLIHLHIMDEVVEVHKSGEGGLHVVGRLQVPHLQHRGGHSELAVVNVAELGTHIYVPGDLSGYHRGAKPLKALTGMGGLTNDVEARQNFSHRSGMEVVGGIAGEGGGDEVGVHGHLVG